MPIRFRCPRCQQRLSIGAHKSGVLIECPTCKEQVRVPEGSEVLSVRGPSTSEMELEVSSPSKSTTVPMADLAAPVMNSPPLAAASAVIPSSPSVSSPSGGSTVAADFYAPQRSPSVSFENSPWVSKLDHSRVTIPRYVIYSQGLLLGVVGLVCLVIGVFLGRAFSPTTSPIDPATMPCVVSGVVEYEDSQGVRHPDIGAVVLALPAANQPEKSISSEGLGPEDPQPKAEHPGLRELESLGGKIARVSAAGRYELRVPRGGEFYLVAISKQARRGDDPHQPKITSTIGKYIAPATKLLGDHKYLMQEPVLREERHADFFFKRLSAE